MYGRETLADVAQNVRVKATALGFALEAMQSNHEGALVDMIHQARQSAAGIIINPGAYSHTSIAILDALMSYEGPVLEVHISNIHKRETFRHHSYVSTRAEGSRFWSNSGLRHGHGLVGPHLHPRRCGDVVGRAGGCAAVHQREAPHTLRQRQ